MNSYGTNYVTYRHADLGQFGSYELPSDVMLQLSCKTGGSEFNAYLSYRANEPMLHQSCT